VITREGRLKRAKGGIGIALRKHDRPNTILLFPLSYPRIELGVVLASLGFILVIVPLASLAVKLFFSFVSLAVIAVKL
jgi:hypothetical protein